MWQTSQPHSPPPPADGKLKLHNAPVRNVKIISLLFFLDLNPTAQPGSKPTQDPLAREGSGRALGKQSALFQTLYIEKYMRRLLIFVFKKDLDQ